MGGANEDLRRAVLTVCIIVLVAFSGVLLGVRSVRHEAISRGYALYCPGDGDFAWKGECEVPANGQ